MKGCYNLSKHLVKGHVVQNPKQLLSSQQGLHQDVITVIRGCRGAGTVYTINQLRGFKNLAQSYHSAWKSYGRMNILAPGHYDRRLLICLWVALLVATHAFLQTAAAQSTIYLSPTSYQSTTYIPLVPGPPRLLPISLPT
jgi:hypothetical protein